MNFQTFVLGSSSSSSFLMLYGLLNGVFLLFIIILFSISGKVFEAQKKEDLKEGTKILLKSLSALMIFYLYLFQIPLISVLLQGFMCNEDPSIPLSLPSITCGSTLNQVLEAVSAVMLIIYSFFLVSQQNLYSSSNFESIVPWGSFERTTSTVRVLIKIIISIGFVFDKTGIYHGPINLVCFFF